MYSYGPPHMAEQKKDGQHEHTYSSYVRIRDVTLKTCQKRWMIGRSGERGSRISVLAARHDDDDNTWMLDFKNVSSSSCRAISTDIPDPLSPLLPIVHRFWQVRRATNRILTELLYVGSSWPPCFCTAIRRGPLEYITYELVPTSPEVSCMFGSSNLDSFRDGW